jgi:hypothetical protein
MTTFIIVFTVSLKNWLKDLVGDYPYLILRGLKHKEVQRDLLAIIFTILVCMVEGYIERLE